MAFCFNYFWVYFFYTNEDLNPAPLSPLFKYVIGNLSKN